MKYHCTRSQTLCSFEDAILKGHFSFFLSISNLFF